jgi:ABC-type Mn2+/Zn2+ transport system permease subunit
MDFFTYPFMQRALIEAVIIGGLCAVIGVYVVLNGLSFIGAGISHSAFGGIALGLFLGINPTVAALLFSIAIAVSIGITSEQGRLKHDTAVGIFFAATMAFGILLISMLKGFYLDIFSYLFGNILAVTNGDIIFTSIIAVIESVIIVLFYKELLAISFDREMAMVMGLPVRKLYYLLLILMSCTVVTAAKAVGIVLISALIVTPAAASYQLTRRFNAMMALSVVFGIGSSLIGLYLSYILNIPSGATIVLVATVIFFVSWLCSPHTRRQRAGRISSAAQ